MSARQAGWEAELVQARRQRIAEVIRRDSSLTWEMIAERWDIPQEDWPAERIALKRLGVRPPPPEYYMHRAVER